MTESQKPNEPELETKETPTYDQPKAEVIDANFNKTLDDLLADPFGTNGSQTVQEIVNNETDKAPRLVDMLPELTAVKLLNSLNKSNLVIKPQSSDMVHQLKRNYMTSRIRC